MSGDVWYHYSSELQWVVFLAIDKHIKMNKFLVSDPLTNIYYLISFLVQFMVLYSYVQLTLSIFQ